MKSQIPNLKSKWVRGFTLVELLVVVTIIVVLLALLAPAMDKAIYQAELAVCGARLNAIGRGAVVYAMENKRSYPHRAGVREDTTWTPAMIYNGNVALNAVWTGLFGTTNTQVYDDRRVLRDFLTLNTHLNDPLTGKLDYENTDLDCTVYTNYSLWFGWRFNGQKGMHRLGDRFTWSSPTKSWRFDVLASDRDESNGGTVQTAHPDEARKTVNLMYQNGQFPIPGGGGTAVKMTIGFWGSGSGRGPVDLNYAFQDGSVQRFNKVTFMDSTMALVDESNTRQDGWKVAMPPQR